MPSQNVAVQKAVYDALSKEKRPGESFTALFRRLLAQREGLEELVGSWSVDRRSPARSPLPSSARSRRP
jgi:predicted CopG family antitoxin